MKRLVLVAMVLVLSAGCGLPTAGYKTLVTKDISICDILKNKTRTEVEKELGGPKKISGDERTYKRGYFTAKVTYSNDTVSTIECETE